MKSGARQVTRPLRMQVLDVKVSEDIERESSKLYQRTASKSETRQEYCDLLLF